MRYHQGTKVHLVGKADPPSVPYMAIGHVTAGFLALLFEVDLQRRLDEREVKVSWPDLMRDLSQVHSVIVYLNGKGYRLRTSLVGNSYQAFLAAGIRPPETVTLPGNSHPRIHPSTKPPRQLYWLFAVSCG